jgi:hypothetical protein
MHLKGKYWEEFLGLLKMAKCDEYDIIENYMNCLVNQVL